MSSSSSTAVRAVIERHQPLLAVHGHIHESQGRLDIGRTVCVNPGSEYTEGVLKGVLIRLQPDRVKSVQFVQGQEETCNVHRAHQPRRERSDPGSGG